MWSTAATCNMPAGCRLPSTFASCNRGTAAPATTATTCCRRCAPSRRRESATRICTGWRRCCTRLIRCTRRRTPSSRSRLDGIRHPPEQPRLLGAAGCDQAIARLLDLLAQAVEELLARQVRRQRIEKLDHQRARITHEGAARPEQAGIECNRQARHPAVGIDLNDTALVVRRRARRRARALRKDHELAAMANLLAGSL